MRFSRIELKFVRIDSKVIGSLWKPIATKSVEATVLCLYVLIELSVNHRKTVFCLFISITYFLI